MRRVSILVLVYGLACPAFGQEKCLDVETIGECWARVVEPAVARFPNPGTPTEAQKESASEPALVEAAREATKRLIEKQAGFESIGTGVASALSDFLPFLTARIDAGAVSQDDSGLHVELNEFLGLPTNENYRIGATFRDPGLFQPIVEALPAATRDARKSALEKDLSDADDVSLSVSWSPVGPRIGRGYVTASDPKSADVFTLLFSPAISRGTSNFGRLREQDADIKAWTSRFLDPLHERMGLMPGADPAGPRFDAQVFADDVPLRKEIEKEIFRLATPEREFEQQIAKAAATAEIFRFADLVNNQPQLVVSGGTRIRANRAGPDEANVHFSYEHGFRNVNSLLEKCPQAAPTFLDCFTAYYQENKDELERGDRFSVSLDYTYTDNYEFSSTADSLTLNLDKEHHLAAALVYGRYLTFASFGADAPEKTRLDVSASYDEYFKDPNRQSRAVVSATASRTLFSGFSLALGFTWANKPEFRGAADHEITANFGLNYKLDWDRGKEK